MGLAGAAGLIYAAGFLRPWWLTAPAVLLSALAILLGAHVGTDRH